jgi:6-pyruvoyltetrahydropterin/6-carboxytetrahydropterin synthase
MPISIVKSVKFCAGHRIANHEGKDANLHGHNYCIDLTVTTDKLNELGFVIDFSILKSRFKGWFDDNWDHGFLLCEDDTVAIEALGKVNPTKIFLFPGVPTSENIALFVLNTLSPELLADTNARVTKVTVWENAESFAEASLDSEVLA